MKKILIFLGLRKRKITAKEALSILEPIPEEEFTRGTMIDEYNKSCAVGWINRKLRKKGIETEKAYPEDNSGYGIVEISKKFLRERGSGDKDIMTINDLDYIPGYEDPTPKKRVIHLLEDMVKAGY